MRIRGTGRVNRSHSFNGVDIKLYLGAVELGVLRHHVREESMECASGLDIVG